MTKRKREIKKKIDKLQSFKPQKIEFLSKTNMVEEEEQEQEEEERRRMQII